MKYKIYYNPKRNISHNYKLIKESNSKSLTCALTTPKVIKKYDNIDIIKIRRENFGEYIIKFINVIKKNFSNIDLSILYNNLSTISTSTKNYNLSNFIHRTNVEGAYEPIENKIKLGKDNYYLTIFHELFHASSTIVDSKSNTIFSGFEQINMDNTYLIGEGINEGYTQYLTEKIFNNEEVLKAYSYLVIIAMNVEKIIGKDKMQELYFSANLKGLIDCLLQYKSKEEIYKFINILDCIT